MFARLAQVVYTLTEFDTVKDVRFMLDGEPVDVFSGEGILLEEPVGRQAVLRAHAADPDRVAPLRSRGP